MLRVHDRVLLIFPPEGQWPIGTVVELRPETSGCLVLLDREPKGPFGWSFNELKRIPSVGEVWSPSHPYGYDSPVEVTCVSEEHSVVVYAGIIGSGGQTKSLPLHVFVKRFVFTGWHSLTVRPSRYSVLMEGGPDLMLGVQGVMPISYVTGDATDPRGEGPRVITHCCNDIGRWGAGFSGALSARWEPSERFYRLWARQKGKLDGDEPVMETSGPFALGEIQVILVAPQLWICNLIGQHGIGFEQGKRAPIRYDAIQQGLRKLCRIAKIRSATVHMPRMGSGLAGGHWPGVEQMVQQELASKGVPVTVYDLPPRER